MSACGTITDAPSIEQPLETIDDRFRTKHLQQDRSLTLVLLQGSASVDDGHRRHSPLHSQERVARWSH